MISYLKGTVLHKSADSVILFVQGVGYKVFVGEQALADLRESQETELFCASRLRGEALELYGVPSSQALQVFEVLDKISGIGPKAALALSSFGSVEGVKAAIQSGKLGHLKGIGAKKLQKILLELSGTVESRPAGGPVPDEAVQGLMSLGFSRKQAQEALAQVSPDITSASERIKGALKVIRPSA